MFWNFGLCIYRMRNNFITRELLQLSHHSLPLGSRFPLHPKAVIQPATPSKNIVRFWTPDIFTVFISKTLFFWKVTSRSEVNGSRCFEAKWCVLLQVFRGPREKTKPLRSPKSCSLIIPLQVKTGQTTRILSSKRPIIHIALCNIWRH